MTRQPGSVKIKQIACNVIVFSIKITLPEDPVRIAERIIVRWRINTQD